MGGWLTLESPWARYMEEQKVVITSIAEKKRAMLQQFGRVISA